MPSAAKLEKQASTEAVDPIRQAIIIIEHKIRNLEKRKRKIESYRELQKGGKELNADQLNSVAKYEEVLQTLEFARDLCKQFNGIAVDAVKQHKKQARKEAQERAQQEIAKVKEILMVQDVLQNMGQDNVREDFLAGRNGAAQLTEEELKCLDDLFSEVSPKHSTEDGLPPFQEQLQQSAEHLLAIVDAKPKEIVGTTYAKLKELVATIQGSGYFDQSVEEPAEEPVNEVTDSVIPVAPDETTEEEEYVIEGQAVVVPSETPAYSPAVVPVVAAAPVPAIIQQAPVVTPVPTPVAAVESSFFSTNAPAFVPAQPPIPSRPLNEVIGSVSGSFNFLQESELDSPDLAVMLTSAAAAQQPQQHTGPTPPPSASVAVAPIPSQTFTNQNFAAVSTTPVQPKVVYQPSAADMSQSHIPGFVTTPNPPPPIPMPPSHQQPQQQHRSMSPAVTYGGQVVAQGPSYASQAQQQQQPATTLQYAASQQQPVDPTVFTAHHAQEIVESVEHQQVPEQTSLVAEEATDDWGQSEVSPGSGDWIQQTDANQGDWSQQTDEWPNSSTNQNDSYVTQTSNRGYGRGRGNRGGRGNAPNGYSGGRGRGGNYQNGRGGSGGGGGGGGYGYRNNTDGNNSYYQNGYQQRDNFSGSGGGSNNYKRGRGGAGSGGAPRSGMERGGPRGSRGGSNNPRSGNRGSSSNYVRGGGSKQ